MDLNVVVELLQHLKEALGSVFDFHLGRSSYRLQLPKDLEDVPDFKEEPAKHKEAGCLPL